MDSLSEAVDRGEHRGRARAEHHSCGKWAESVSIVSLLSALHKDILLTPTRRSSQASVMQNTKSFIRRKMICTIDCVHCKTGPLKRRAAVSRNRRAAGEMSRVFANLDHASMTFLRTVSFSIRSRFTAKPIPGPAGGSIVPRLV